MTKRVEIWNGHTQSELVEMIAAKKLEDLEISELFDAVIHIAAWIGVWFSVEGPNKGGKDIFMAFKEELFERDHELRPT